jgi:hypothetical protein
MRSVEFHTYLLPSAQGDGTYRPSRQKLTCWQAIAYPGATPIEGSREVRQCPESADERKELGFSTPEEAPTEAPVGARGAGRRSAKRRPGPRP